MSIDRGITEYTPAKHTVHFQKCFWGVMQRVCIQMDMSIVFRGTPLYISMDTTADSRLSIQKTLALRSELGQ